MLISFDTASLTQRDIAVIQAVAAALDSKTQVSSAPQLPLQPQPEVGENTGTDASGPLTEGAGVSGEAGGNVSAASPAPENPSKRRGRPTNAEKAAAEAAAKAAANAKPAPTEAPAPAPAAAVANSATDAKPAGTGSAVVTADDVLAALQAYTAKNTVEAGVKLLAEFGATRRSELKPDQYAEFVRRCSEEVAA